MSDWQEFADRMGWRYVALFNGQGERVSEWVGIRPDGSSDGTLQVQQETMVWSWGFAQTPDGPVLHVNLPAGGVPVHPGDTVWTPAMLVD